MGIAAGQSVQAWHEFFPDAEIHAFDVHWMNEKVKNSFEKMKPRVRAHIVNILKDEENGLEDFIPESMDIIIEDTA